MQIINAAPKQNEQTAAANSAIENPAMSYGQYHAEFGFQPLNKEHIAPEVPEIRVNGVLIPEQAVLKEVQHHPADSKRAAQIKAAETLIIGELLRQEAQSLGLMPESMRRHTAEEADAIQSLIDQEVPYPKATLEEQQRFFNANQSKFTTSPLLVVRHILLAVGFEDVNERLTTKEIADNIILQLKSTPSLFEEFVKQHSACPSKSEGGSLGQVSQGQTVPEFERAIFAAKEGLIGYPIETRYGFHIVMVDQKIEGRALPFEYVQQQVAEYLNEKVKRKATAHYIQTLIEKSKIVGFTFDLEVGVMQ